MKKTQRGFTLVETIVALALISVISALAVTVTLLNRSASNKARDSFLAVNLCSNATAIFRSSVCEDYDKTYSDFKDKVSNILGLTLSETHTQSKITAFATLGDDWTQDVNGKILCEITFEASADAIVFTINVTKNDTLIESANWIYTKETP